MKSLIQKNKFLLLWITIGHLILSLGLFFLSFSLSMGRMENGAEASAFESVVKIASSILMLPLSSLIPLLKGPMFGGLWGYLPFFINSFLWALLIVWVREKKWLARS